MEGFIVIIRLAFCILCAVALYKCIIGTLDTIEDVVGCIKDIRYTLSNIQTMLKERTR